MKIGLGIEGITNIVTNKKKIDKKTNKKTIFIYMLVWIGVNSLVSWSFVHKVLMSVSL